MNKLIILAVLAFAVATYAEDIDFYLTYRGKTKTNPDGTIDIQGSANSQTTTTLIDSRFGVIYKENSLIGAVSIWHTIGSDPSSGQYTESGNVTFGGSHRFQVHGLSVELLYQETVTSYNGVDFGVGAYNVTDGFGAFESAYGGRIAFTSKHNTTSNEFEVKATGIFVVPDSE
eukprot:TRINITY_DN234_c0_g1_i1.p1 TRINITY_DN234_c0_g1~~TRINITY_DN234_c0_g1_i1.p1  ORF type:complete len:173 (-),score=45.15 TRINITY_DN234_c0_g1_i1:71-589(-)